MDKIKEALRKSIQAQQDVEKTPVEKRALGRGLAALIGDRQEQAFRRSVPIFTKDAPRVAGDVVYIDVERISSGKFQPRENFDGEKLQELMSSIKEKGVLQPILIRPIENGFEIIAGERRFRACREIGLKKIPVIIKEVSDEDALIISLMENIQRQELNPIEEARAYQQLVESFNLSQDNVAKAVGKNKTTISNMLRLLKLPEAILKYLGNGDISVGHAKALLGIEDSAQQRKFCQITISKSLSVRELENLITRNVTKKRRAASIAPSSDPYLVNIERQLQLALGTKVRIMAQRKRGKIVIEYYSPQDLERLVGLLKK